MSYSLSRRLPQPLGLRGALPVLCAVAAFGAAITCRAEPPAAAQTHSIELAAGDFVRAVVKQVADVRVELIDPGGREMLHVDGPNGTREDEEIAAVAERAGPHELRVLGCPRSAPAAACYTLHLDPPRPATEENRRRAEAVRMTQDAADAMLTRSEASWRLQAATRERALALWSGLGERRRAAEELYQLGIVHRLLRQLDPAVRRLHEAAAIWAALGDTTREAEALNEAGWACEEAGNLDHALEDYRQALAKAQEANDRRRQGDILNNLGLLLNRLGERREALVHLQQALALAEELGGAANILNSLGMIYSDLGETHVAIKLYKQVLALPGITPLERAAAHNNLGADHATLGDWDEAIENYNQAIVINRQEKDTYRLASTLNNLGLTQHHSGDLEAARASYEEALTLARTTGNREVQILAANNFGLLLDQQLRQPEKARAQWAEAARLAEDFAVLDYVGLAARAAVEHSERRFTEARANLQKAIAQARRKEELRFTADLTLRLARVERDSGDLAAAAEHAEEAVQGIESVRMRVPTPDQRALFLASRQSFYALYLDILMDLHRQQPGKGFDTRALQVNERARARSLLDLLGEAEADLRKGVPPELLERERRVRLTLRERDLHHMELIHGNASVEQIAQATERLNEALDESEEVEEAILRASSESYTALVQPRPLDVQEIREQVLSDRTLLLEYSLGEERSYLWALTASTFQSFDLPGRKQIETAALGFYNAITARNDEAPVDVTLTDAAADRAALELSRAILAPVEKLLEDRILLVVSDGVLQYVPFAALPLPSAHKERVAHRNQVVSLPSASTLALLRRDVEKRPSAPKTLAVLADPVFSLRDARLSRLAGAKKPTQKSAAVQRGLPPRGPLRTSDQLSLERLIFSEKEARDILSFVEPGQALEALGFAASYATATSGQLASYRYVHFATHGLIDSQQPKLSKLALSQFDKDGSPQDGFLRLSDIYNLDLNADLVTLSACQTALGKEVRGEGLIGLTRGFMYAGAARVLASLWSVDDRSTAKLMKSFYRYLLVEKRSAAEALRRAQLDMARQPPHDSPYYWAGFSLQGEWK